MISTNIILKKGLKGLPFGIDEQVLINTIGQPMSISEIDYLEDEAVKEYNYPNIIFSFSESRQFRLNEILIEGKQYKINNIKLIGQDLYKSIDLLQDKGYNSPSIEVISNEYVENTIFLFYNEIGLTLVFQDYVCKRIIICPVYNDKDEIIWP